MSEGAFIIGPGGRMTHIEGARGTTPPCPEAMFKPNDVVRVRRLRHLRHLPVLGAIAVVVPPGFSADHAWDDFCGRPRRLMHVAPSARVYYIVGFEGDPAPHLLPERALMPSGEARAEVKLAPR
jgi:hypothetical protein